MVLSATINNVGVRYIDDDHHYCITTTKAFYYDHLVVVGGGYWVVIPLFWCKVYSISPHKKKCSAYRHYSGNQLRRCLRGTFEVSLAPPCDAIVRSWLGSWYHVVPSGCSWDARLGCQLKSVPVASRGQDTAVHRVLSLHPGHSNIYAHSNGIQIISTPERVS